MASNNGSASLVALAKQRGSLQNFRDGVLAPFIGDGPVLEIGGGEPGVADESQAAVFAGYWLQGTGDYRCALQSWFRAVRVGGHLIVVVSNTFLYDRQLALPARWNPDQRRLYTPASLLDEVEEALAPNSYRVRFLGDDDRDYDYDLPSDVEPSGHSDIVLVLEKIRPPAWVLGMADKIEADTPDYAFEPPRTRVETVTLRPRRRILILKFDHLGDFIMGVPALQKARAAFAGAEITLAVGSWNLAMAQDMGLADRVVAFDAFPRNSTEEEADVHATVAMFRSAFPDEYDLAIDLRNDLDTRVLLRHAQAKIKAGIGTRAQFPFLDIFLPLDFNRNEPETAREERFGPLSFASQGVTARSDHRIRAAADRIERHSAVVWGPYHRLRPGRYFFEPFIELDDAAGDATLMLDVGLSADRVASILLPTSDRLRLYFEVEKPQQEFEFRIWTVQDAPPIGFNFFGGRLVREGAASVLHQSEYLALLIELITIRLDRMGVLGEIALP